MISSVRYSTFFCKPLDRVTNFAAGIAALGPCGALACSTIVASLPPLPGAAGAAGGGAPFAGAAGAAGGGAPFAGTAGAAGGGAPFAGAASVAAATAVVSAPFVGGAGGAPLPGAAGAPPVGAAGAAGGEPFAAGVPLLGGDPLVRSESSLLPRFESCCGAPFDSLTLSIGSSAGSGVFGLAGCFGAIFLGGTLSKTAQLEHTTKAFRAS